MLIAQITDIHIGFDKGNPDEHNMVRLRAVLGHLVNGPNRPDLLLLSGDLTEDGAPADYARLAEAVAICPFPVWPMTGNLYTTASLTEECTVSVIFNKTFPWILFMPAILSKKH